MRSTFWVRVSYMGFLCLSMMMKRFRVKRMLAAFSSLVLIFSCKFLR